MLVSLTDPRDINIVLSRCAIQVAAMRKVLKKLEEISNRMFKSMLLDFIVIVAISTYIFVSLGNLMANWNTLYVVAVSSLTASAIIVWYLMKKYTALTKIEDTRRRLEHMFDLIKDSVNRGTCSDELAEYDVLSLMKFYLDLEEPPP